MPSTKPDCCQDPEFYGTCAECAFTSCNVHPNRRIAEDGPLGEWGPCTIQMMPAGLVKTGVLSMILEKNTCTMRIGDEVLLSITLEGSGPANLTNEEWEEKIWDIFDKVYEVTNGTTERI